MQSTIGDANVLSEHNANACVNHQDVTGILRRKLIKLQLAMKVAMQTGIMSLQVICAVNRVDSDLPALARECAITQNELSIEQLLRLAKRSGFKVKLKTFKPSRLPKKYPLPAIIVSKDQTYNVLLKRDLRKQAALIFNTQTKQTSELPERELDLSCQNRVIVLSHKRSSESVATGFAWFYQEVFKYKAILAEVFTGSFMVQTMGLVLPLFTQVILDKVIQHRSMSTLDVIAVAFAVTCTVEFLLNIVRNYIFTHTANKIDAALGARLFRHLFSLPFVYFESRRVGTTVARVRELDNIREFITSKSVSVIIDLIFSTVFLVMMFFYSVELTMVVLLFIVIVGTLYVTVTPELRRRLDEKFQMSAHSQSYLVESVTGIQTVKSLAIEGAMQRKWEDALGNYLRSSFKLTSLGNVTGAISNFCQKAMTLAILYIGVKLVIEQKMSVGMLIAFQMYANQFTNPVLRLVNLWNEFQQTLLAVDRLGDILEQSPENTSHKSITLSQLKGHIKFDNVSFRYRVDGADVLKQISFELPAGQSLGIVGRSGSGKSTVAKIIQRLYMPYSGTVLIDGIDVRQLNPVWLRQSTGVVLQDNYLFSGSVRDNIAMPKPHASAEEIITAAQIAGAHEFITEFTHGYDTEVGERGSTLSGGQRQRVAIARALISNPHVLIFDEATSALDYESERLIQQNMNSIKKGRTFIVIAHRLSTIKDCDQIIVMDKGEIVERGSHTELLEQKGFYYSLWQQQVGIRAVV